MVLCRSCANTHNAKRPRRSPTNIKSIAPDVPVPQRIRMRIATKELVRRGVIVKPTRCERCRRTDKARHPWARIEAHHIDYVDPKNVLWLCGLCHQDEHAALRAARDSSAARTEGSGSA
jgi:hypothetical protein